VLKPEQQTVLEPSDRLARSREIERLIEATVLLVREQLAAEGDLPGAEMRNPEHLAETLEFAPPVEGLEFETVVDRLRGVMQATPSSSSWRFLNQLFGGREPVAAAAEVLAVVSNISMYTFKAAGAQILLERALLRSMADAVGLQGAEGTFTPGGSIANLVAMLLARAQAAPDAREAGLDGSPLLVYTSAEGHYSVPKNAGILGIGRRHVRKLPTTPDGRMDVAALERTLSADRAAGLRPMLVNATAGTTVRGAFDPIREIAAVAREHGAWLHVDGALGASLSLSINHRLLLDGVELADSVTWDPHKMMGVPLQTSVLLVARRGLLHASLDETAEYLFQADSDSLNPGHMSIQCGRRNDALRLWTAWLRLGDRGWEARLDRQMALARRAAELIDADPALELTEPPPSINVCFEVKGRSSSSVCQRLDRDGRLKIGYGTVSGRQVIRLVCVNPELDEDALVAILGEIKAAASELPEGDNRVRTSS